LSSDPQYFKLLGPLRSIELVEQQQKDEYQLFRYRLRYDATSLLVLVVRNGAGKFAGLSMDEEGPE